jgi:Arc/MetJ-type ribon-helix-helix transcriptional regulator
MGRMVRKQIVMDAEQERALAARARALGISQSEFVRRAVEQLLDQPPAIDAQQRALTRLRESWAEAERLGTGSGGARWTREELHERPGLARHERSGVRRGQ